MRINKRFTAQESFRNSFLSPCRLQKLLPERKDGLVPLSDTIESFRQIIDGEADELPENAFFMVGGIDEARKKAETLKA